MKRLLVVALALASALTFVPTAATALPPGVVAGPNSITGTVTDVGGQPLVGIYVTDSTGSTGTYTDVDGSYLLEPLVGGVEYTVTAIDFDDRYPQTTSAPVVVSDAEAVVADIVLQPYPSSMVSGVVTTPDGTPLAGIDVTNGLGASASTGADGRYTLDGLRLDQPQFLVAQDRSGFHGSASQGVAVAADGTTVVDFVLEANPVWAVGTVTDPAGQPVAGVRVQFEAYGSVFTGADGRFALAGTPFPDGTYNLSFDPSNVRPDLRPTDLPFGPVADGVADVSVQLVTAGGFDLTVTSSGLPADARVRVWSGLEFGGVVASEVVGADGTISLSVLNDGEYYLEIESQNVDVASEFYPDTVLRDAAQRFTIIGDQRIAVAIDLEAAASISGTLTMPDGTPGDPTQVRAIPVGLPESQIFEASTCNRPLPGDPAGTFRVGCLHPSVDWKLKGFGVGVADNGYYLNSQSLFNATPIAVDPGQEVTGISWTLPPKSPNPTITGSSQQYFITGTTTPGVRIFGSDFPADPHAIDIRVDSSAFFFPAVDIEVTSVVSANELIATITVQAGEVGTTPIPKALSMTTSIGGAVDSTTTLLFGDPTTPVASLAGRVTDSRGRPVANAWVLIRSTTVDEFGNRPQFTAGTNSDGRWTAQGITPGSYTVLFEGTEKFNAQWWKQKSRLADATVVTLRSGDARTGINATLPRRDPITVLRATPKYQSQSSEISFDLVGQGLGPIHGGFRVSIVTPFGALPLQAESASSTRLHVSAPSFGFPGTWDLVTEWTGDDGSIKSTTCVACITILEPLGVSGWWDNFVGPGSTSTVHYLGVGLTDITKVVVAGKGVTVTSIVGNGDSLDVTFAVKAGTPLGPRAVTITRIDGSTATTEMNVGFAF